MIRMYIQGGVTVAALTSLVLAIFGHSVERDDLFDRGMGNFVIAAGVSAIVFFMSAVLNHVRTEDDNQQMIELLRRLNRLENDVEVDRTTDTTDDTVAAPVVDATPWTIYPYDSR